jgi:outer membrane lipoprotein SlyB
VKRWLCRLLPLLAFPLLFAGCTTADIGKSVSDVGLSGAGGVIGYKVSNGDPAATAGGALAGYLVSKTVQSSQDRSLKDAEKTGYERALNQAVKQQYWIIQNQQKSLSPEGARDPRLVPVVIPETKINGVTIKAHVEVLRVEL